MGSYLFWTEKSSSASICQTWWIHSSSCSFGCIWEWLNGWIDHSDLPELRFIELGVSALYGDSDDDRKTISTEPYNYKNTLTMRSESEWNDEWIDLPSLTSFKGDWHNFQCMGSVILESSHLVIDSCRYFSIIIGWNHIRFPLLRVHPLPPTLKYLFSHLIIIRCPCSRISHHKPKQIPLILIPSFLLSWTVIIVNQLAASLQQYRLNISTQEHPHYSPSNTHQWVSLLSTIH